MDFNIRCQKVPNQEQFFMLILKKVILVHQDAYLQNNGHFHLEKVPLITSVPNRGSTGAPFHFIFRIKTRFFEISNLNATTNIFSKKKVGNHNIIISTYENNIRFSKKQDKARYFSRTNSWVNTTVNKNKKVIFFQLIFYFLKTNIF